MNDVPLPGEMAPDDSPGQSEVLTPILVNKRELCGALRVSPQALETLMGKYPDFPIVKRGFGGGESWQFDLRSVTEFLAVKRNEEAEARAERLRQIAEFKGDVTQLSIDDRGELKSQIYTLRIREALRREMVETGQLVNAARVEEGLGAAFAVFSAGLREFVGQLARRHRWSDEELDGARTLLDDVIRGLLAEMPRVLAAARSGAEDDNKQRSLANI